MNCIFTENYTQVFSSTIQGSSQSDSIYTLEDLIQTLEEAANYIASFSQNQAQVS